MVKPWMMACEGDGVRRVISIFYFNYNYLCLVMKLYRSIPYDKIDLDWYDVELKCNDL